MSEEELRARIADLEYDLSEAESRADKAETSAAEWEDQFNTANSTVDDLRDSINSILDIANRAS